MMKVVNQKISIVSIPLKRTVIADILLPHDYDPTGSYPLLILNDGQDAEQLDLKTIVNDLWNLNLCKPFIAVAPHTTNRLHEYGVSSNADFKGRGSLAGEYSQFVTDELIPFTRNHLKTKEFVSISIAGFSLGGLSAFDIAWNNPGTFDAVAACSGSFWWRQKDLDEGYTDDDRIMHKVVRNTHSKPPLKITLTCGTLDEKADRNNNGIIDSVDDTMDLKNELEKKGFIAGQDLTFNLVIGGRHTQETYGIMLADFMKQSYPK